MIGVVMLWFGRLMIGGDLHAHSGGRGKFYNATGMRRIYLLTSPPALVRLVISSKTVTRGSYYASNLMSVFLLSNKMIYSFL